MIADCPTRDQLHLQLEIGTHLEECSACQEAMEQLTASAGGLWPAPETRNESSSSTTGPVIAGVTATELPRIPGYEVLEELGRGGMGVVYRARQQTLNRLVALKMIPPGSFPSLAAVQRLRKEAELVATLDHPAIVPIYEVGEHAGQPFLAMKLIEGGRLSDHLDRYAPNPKLAAETFATLAEAVAHAHARHVLHRDLKPSNVLLDGDGRPQVTDFGLARHLEGEPGLTQTGELLGTPNYMAPEQASAARGATTPATDVYGLGAILYTLLTRKPPFQGATLLDTLEQVKHAEPEPPGRSNRLVGRELETICLKCLEKDPARRYASAQALAEDLQRFLRGEPIRARPVGRAERLLRWCLRNRLVAGLTVAAGLLLMIAVASLVIGLVSVSNERNLTQNALGESRENERRAVAARHRAEENHKSALDLANALLSMWAVRNFGSDPKANELRIAQFEWALRVWKRSVIEKSPDPDIRLESANALVYISGIYNLMGNLEEASRARSRAAALLEALAAEFPTHSAVRMTLSSFYYDRARDNLRSGQSEQAVQGFRKAKESFRLALELEPDNPLRMDSLAWFLVTCPDTHFHDAKEAIALAEEAVQLQPQRHGFLCTLGVAYYRAGKWEKAKTALLEATGLEQDSYDCYFLAMACWRLQEQEQARKWYGKAVERSDKYELKNDEELRFRDEAAALMRIPDPEAKDRTRLNARD